MQMTQQGDITRFRHPALMDDDVLAISHPVHGAKIIVICSLFMDYGHFLNSFDINEIEFRQLQEFAKDHKDHDLFEEYLDGLYKKYVP